MPAKESSTVPAYAVVEKSGKANNSKLVNFIRFASILECRESSRPNQVGGASWQPNATMLRTKKPLVKRVEKHGLPVAYQLSGIVSSVSLFTSAS